MNALSFDLRQRIVAAVDGGVSKSETARRFAVSRSTGSRSTVHRLLLQRRESGTLEARSHPGAARRIRADQQAAVAAQMRTHRHASLEEHTRLWREQQGQTVSPSTLWRTLQRMNWSHKKRASVPVSATKRRVKSGATKSNR